MKIGVTTFMTDEGIRPVLLAKALEERAFDSLFLHEHSHVAVKQETPFPGGGALPRVYYRTLDPFVALTAAAAVTDNLVLGTGVALLVQRDVIHTAKQVASLDLVSGGRVIFGVGTGWSREEMRNHGTDPHTRGKLLNEQLAAIKEMEQGQGRVPRRAHWLRPDFLLAQAGTTPASTHLHWWRWRGGVGQGGGARRWLDAALGGPPGPGPVPVEPVGRGRRGQAGDGGVRVGQVRTHRRLRGGGS